ncbi:MAG: response regulator transcription factor [Bacteroidota bacterium]
MNCIIIEDQPPAQRILKKYIADIGSLELKAVFSDALKAMELLKTEKVDLIFLDIHLPKISGIDFLKTMSNPPHVILTTAFSDYALQSYDFGVVDYLLKPFSFQRFVKAVNRVPTKEESDISENTIPTNTSIFIKSGYEHIKIDANDIIYIKSDADYTEIHLSNQKYLSSEPLRYWMETLNNQQFVRVHKSFVINGLKIKKISGGQIYLTKNTVVPIGRAYKEAFMKRFLK